MSRTVIMAWVTLIMIAVVYAAPASANTTYPAGCDGSGGATWPDYCWLGFDGTKYWKSGNNVVGTQRILSGTTNPGPIDGIFGSMTRSAVEDFQQQEGIGVDGIVGQQTWTKLRGRVYYDHSEAGYHWYFISYVTGLHFGQRRTSPNNWITHQIDGVGWMNFDTSGPS